MDDATIADAARREVHEKTGVAIQNPQHAGDCYMAVRHEGEVIMNSLMHVFVASVKKHEVALADNALWRLPSEMSDAAPATQHIVDLIGRYDGKTRFFEEFVEEL